MIKLIKSFLKRLLCDFPHTYKQVGKGATYTYLECTKCEHLWKRR